MQQNNNEVKDLIISLNNNIKSFSENFNRYLDLEKDYNKKNVNNDMTNFLNLNKDYNKNEEILNGYLEALSKMDNIFEQKINKLNLDDKEVILLKDEIFLEINKNFDKIRKIFSKELKTNIITLKNYIENFFENLNDDNLLVNIISLYDDIQKYFNQPNFNNKIINKDIIKEYENIQNIYKLFIKNILLSKLIILRNNIHFEDKGLSNFCCEINYKGIYDDDSYINYIKFELDKKCKTNQLIHIFLILSDDYIKLDIIINFLNSLMNNFDKLKYISLGFKLREGDYGYFKKFLIGHGNIYFYVTDDIFFDFFLKDNEDKKNIFKIN